MDQLEGKVAVITGAASGMGLAFAHRFAQSGMHVVMSDIEEPALNEAAAAVEAHGGRVVTTITDVSDAAEMDALAETTFSELGTAHIVCNNAGVAGNLNVGGDIDAAEWKWVIDVNLWGVIHGHRVFLPRLMEQDDGHIVNTASIAGHVPGHSAYSASKWGVVGITMGLNQQLAQRGSQVGVSCLCPGWVATKINESDRNRPEWATPREIADPTPETEMVRAFVSEAIASGMPPTEVAELVHDAVTNRKFWIFTDMDMVAGLADKHASILENRNPEIVTLLD